jgi:hypothetical protein
MRIGGEIAGGSAGLQQSAEDRPMLLAGSDDLDAWLTQPGIHVGKRIGGRQRASMMPARVVIRTNARITTQGSPTGAASDSTRSSQGRARSCCGESVSMA